MKNIREMKIRLKHKCYVILHIQYRVIHNCIHLHIYVVKMKRQKVLFGLLLIIIIFIVASQLYNTGYEFMSFYNKAGFHSLATESETESRVYDLHVVKIRVVSRIISSTESEESERLHFFQISLQLCRL